MHSQYFPRPAGKLWPELLDTLTRIGSAQLLRGHVAHLLSLTESDLLTSVLSTANVAVVGELRKPPAEDGGQQTEGAPPSSADLGILLHARLLPHAPKCMHSSTLIRAYMLKSTPSDPGAPTPVASPERELVAGEVAKLVEAVGSSCTIDQVCRHC